MGAQVNERSCEHFLELTDRELVALLFMLFCVLYVCVCLLYVTVVFYCSAYFVCCCQ